MTTPVELKRYACPDHQAFEMEGRYSSDKQRFWKCRRDVVVGVNFFKHLRAWRQEFVNGKWQDPVEIVNPCTRCAEAPIEAHGICGFCRDRDSELRMDEQREASDAEADEA
jgi:hypothetical protein